MASHQHICSPTVPVSVSGLWIPSIPSPFHDVLSRMVGDTQIWLMQCGETQYADIIQHALCDLNHILVISDGTVQIDEDSDVKLLCAVRDTDLFIECVQSVAWFYLSYVCDIEDEENLGCVEEVIAWVENRGWS